MDVKKSDRLIAMIRAGRVFITDLKESDGFEVNNKRLIAYFKSHLNSLVSSLSIETLTYLRQVLKCTDKDMTLSSDYAFNEDFFFLVELGVLNPNTLRIAKGYKKIVENVLLDPNIDQICYIHTLLKGLIDLYGEISMDDLKDVLSRLLPRKCSKRQIYDMYKNCPLIVYKCKVTHNYVARYEVYNILKDFLNVRDATTHEPFKIYPISDILTFANSFDFSGITPFTRPEEIPLRMSRILQMMIDVDDVLLDRCFQNDEERIQFFINYNNTYPKWVLKGHCSDFVYNILPHQEVYGLHETRA